MENQEEVILGQSSMADTLIINCFPCLSSVASHRTTVRKPLSATQAPLRFLSRGAHLQDGCRP